MTALWVQPSDLGDYELTEYAQEACETASFLMWALSGRKYTGTTTVTERYVCAKRAYRLGASSRNYGGILVGGEVYNIPINDFDNYAELVADGLAPESRIRLRGKNVTKIHAVRDRTGNILDPSSYYLVDHSVLQATAGVPWTPCNVEITYTYGSPVPAAGRMAARTLALEFARLWSGDDDCALPQRVTSISRQGVSYTLLDSQDFIDDMRTGVYAVDLFLKSVNPDGAKRRSKVFSPDVPRARRYTPKANPLTANTKLDLSVVKTTPATWNSNTATADVTIFFDEVGWTPQLTLSNYGGTKSVNVSSSNITVNNASERITFSIPYADAYNALGIIYPGTWTLYATKTVGNVDTVSEVVTGNLTIKLYN
jgi:hypothetical protein